LPNEPFAPPVTLDEIYRNIAHDLGWYPEVVSTPVELKSLLLALGNGQYNSSLATYGSGADGAVQFTTNANGNATATLWNGTVLTASSNTFTLTQDLWLGQTGGTGAQVIPTVATGVTINANGFRIFCQGMLRNNGTISSVGNNAATTTAGAALSYTSTISNTTVGGAGGTGATTGNNAGSNVTGSLGGAGGQGGNNASAAPAAGGTVTAPTAVTSLPFSLPYATMVRTAGTTALSLLTGGAGGSSGQGDATNNSGAGGGGGGIVMIAAQRLGGTGTISVAGGTGSAASATGASGGGGGGGGGCLIIISRTVQTLSFGSALAVSGQTLSVAGGAGGAGGATGFAGNAGNSGRTILIPD
jgi:hypothetical protein